MNPWSPPWASVGLWYAFLGQLYCSFIISPCRAAEDTTEENDNSPYDGSEPKSNDDKSNVDESHSCVDEPKCRGEEFFLWIESVAKADGDFSTALQIFLIAFPIFFMIDGISYHSFILDLNCTSNG